MKRLLFISGITMCLTLLNLPGALASGPWHWVMTLRQPKVKDAMINPTSIYIDPKKGRYYVVDSGKDRLLSFDRDGKLLHILTAGDDLHLPMDMVRSDDGGIWIVEKNKNSLSKIDLRARRVIRHHLSVMGRTVYPHRVEFVDKRFFILDKRSGWIFSFDRDLRHLASYPCEGCGQGFVDFKVYDHGTLLALTPDRGGVIYEFGLDGKLKRQIELHKRALFPVSVARGPSGYLYVLDRHNSKILVFDGRGTYKYSFLDYGSSQGQLYYPVEIRFDSMGRLYVVEEGNARVEVFAR